LDISHNPELYQLVCAHNNLTSLDISHNPELEWLVCAHNNLTSLDLSHNPKLEEFICFHNNLTTLDISHNPNLKEISCTSNSLTTLDTSNNPELDWLSYDRDTVEVISDNPELATQPKAAQSAPAPKRPAAAYTPQSAKAFAKAALQAKSTQARQQAAPSRKGGVQR
jgi:Leucine-rich repeat (LRR) protein